MVGQQQSMVVVTPLVVASPAMRAILSGQGRCGSCEKDKNTAAAAKIYYWKLYEILYSSISLKLEKVSYACCM